MGDPADPVDRALLDLDESWTGEADAEPAAEPPVANDRTMAGLGVGTPLPTPVVAAPTSPMSLLRPRRRPTTRAPGLALTQPEQSPLSFVMRASEASAAPPKETSHDMSMFVDGLVAETAPVVETPSSASVMEPVMRQSRKRRGWFVAGAIAATAIAGTLLGVHLAGGETSPKVAPNETPAAAALAPANIEPTKQQPAAAIPPTTTPPTAPPTTNVAPPPAEVATAAAPTVDVANPTQPTVAPVVAMSKTTVTTHATSTKTTHTTTKTTSTKSTPKKAAPKKVATAKTSKRPSPFKKQTTAKKPAPAKKATPAKKTKK